MFQAIGGRSAYAARLFAARCPALVQPTRGRKSRSDPKAKSKEDRIKVPPAVDPREMLVIKERFSEYRLMLKALRLDFKEEVLRRKYEAETGSMAEVRMEQEEAEHQMLMAWNNEENLRLLKIRVQRVQREQEEAQRKEAEAILMQEEQEQEMIKEREREILKLQEDVKNFITLENLDQRIEEVLDSPKNYNFAINRDGQVVKSTVLK